MVPYDFRAMGRVSPVGGKNQSIVIKLHREKNSGERMRSGYHGWLALSIQASFPQLSQLSNYFPFAQSWFTFGFNWQYCLMYLLTQKPNTDQYSQDHHIQWCTLCTAQVSPAKVRSTGQNQSCNFVRGSTHTQVATFKCFHKSPLSRKLALSEVNKVNVNL